MKAQQLPQQRHWPRVSFSTAAARRSFLHFALTSTLPCSGYPLVGGLPSSACTRGIQGNRREFLAVTLSAAGKDDCSDFRGVLRAGFDCRARANCDRPRCVPAWGDIGLRRMRRTSEKAAICGQGPICRCRGRIVHVCLFRFTAHRSQTIMGKDRWLAGALRANRRLIGTDRFEMDLRGRRI